MMNPSNKEALQRQDQIALVSSRDSFRWMDVSGSWRQAPRRQLRELLAHRAAVFILSCSFGNVTGQGKTSAMMVEKSRKNVSSAPHVGTCSGLGGRARGLWLEARREGTKFIAKIPSPDPQTCRAGQTAVLEVGKTRPSRKDGFHCLCLSPALCLSLLPERGLCLCLNTIKRIFLRFPSSTSWFHSRCLWEVLCGFTPHAPSLFFFFVWSF